MEVFKTFEEEKNKSFASFQNALSCSNKFTSIVGEISKYFQSYSKNIDQFLLTQKYLEHPIEAIGADKKLPVAPGFPGSDSTNFLQYFKLLNILLNTLKTSSQTINTVLIDRINEVNQDFETTSKTLQFHVKESNDQREQSFQAFSAALSALTAQKAKIEKLYNSFSQKSKPKQEQELCKECEEFRQRKIAYELSYRDIYTKHKQFVSLVSSAVLKLKCAEISRISQLKKIILQSSPAIVDDCAKLRQLSSDSKAAEHDWMKDFTYFCTVNGIYRQSFAAQEFVPYHFSFEDSRLDVPIPPRKGSTNTIPLYFATVKEDYAKESECELSVKKDERVFVFDNMNSEYSYVQNANNEAGFVKSSVLSGLNNDSHKYVIVHDPYLACDSEHISVRAGEICLISDESSKLYENIRGEKGKIPDSCILIEKV